MKLVKKNSVLIIFIASCLVASLSLGKDTGRVDRNARIQEMNSSLALTDLQAVEFRQIITAYADDLQNLMVSEKRRQGDVQQLRVALEKQLKQILNKQQMATYRQRLAADRQARQ